MITLNNDTTAATSLMANSQSASVLSAGTGVNEPPSNSVESADGAVQVSLSRQGLDEEARMERLQGKYLAIVEPLLPQPAESGVMSSAGGTDAISADQFPRLNLYTRADVDAYEQRLMSALSERGVDTSIAIDLSVDSEGKVYVSNDHPDKAAIEAAFEDDQDLRNGFIRSSTYFLFQEIASMHDQWLEKIEAGMSEQSAGLWLVDAVQGAVAQGSQGMRFEQGGFTDPFAKGHVNNAAVKAYQA